MLKIKLPGKKSMESSDVKSKQSSSREEIGNMKKKSSAANVRSTGRISSMRVLYEYKPEPENTKRKKSTEVLIVLHDRKSRSKDDINTNIKGDTKQGNEGYNVLPRKSLSKTVSNAKSQGDAKLEAIVALPSSSNVTPSSSDATNKIKTNEVHLKTEDIAKAKKLIKAAKNNKISHATMMTRGRLKRPGSPIKHQVKKTKK
ncbi:uncharacterized protein LOC121735072 [Aricia agestis]|uniref:uncharacterized protein LOC121735072 n=1 Tax=Aricia agestis TaxID=91739 RepID=UPI001C20A738|nr:uncharacterized protein LOC121735072 [Aricia agestis]